MTLGPVISGSRLTEDEVVRTEELTIWSGPNRIHGSGFQVDQDGSGNVLSPRCIAVVDIDAFKLEIRISMVSSSGIDPVFVGDDLPELGSDLVAALAGLNVDDFSHLEKVFSKTLRSKKVEMDVSLL